MLSSYIDNFADFVLNNMYFLEASEQVTRVISGKPLILISPFAYIFGILCNYIFDFVSKFCSSGSLGITIILFTIVVRVLMLPLSAHQHKSMAKMRALQPEMKKIQEKYKGKTDMEARQRMNAEVSELQRKNGANPFSGCLPLLIQLPIISALFYVLQRPYFYIKSIGDIYTEIAQVLSALDVNKETGAAFAGFLYNNIIKNVSALKAFLKGGPFDVFYADNCREIISKFGEVHWDMLLDYVPADTAQKLIPLLEQKANIEYFLGINLVENPQLMSLSVMVPILAGLSTFFSTWMLNKAHGPALDAQAKQQQKIMTIVMPIMMGVMSFSLPSGLGVYWIMGNIFQIGQQRVFNKMYAPSQNS